MALVAPMAALVQSGAGDNLERRDVICSFPLQRLGRHLS